MATTDKNYFSGPGYLYGTATEISTNAGTNQSTVRVSATFGCQSGYAGWSCGSVTYSINGQTKTLNSSYNNPPYDFYYYGNEPNGAWYAGYGEDSGGYWDFVIDHNADGSANNISFSVSASTGVGSPSASSTISLYDFPRAAGTPANATASYTPGSGIVTVTAGASTSYITPVSYYVSYTKSTNGGATWEYTPGIEGSWSGETLMSGQTYNYTSLPLGLTYKFRVRATNGQDGYSGYAESNAVFLASGGKRYTGVAGSEWVQAQTNKRFDPDVKPGGEWVTLTVNRHWNGSAWVDES